MKSIVRIYTNNKEELEIFLGAFYSNVFNSISEKGYWEKEFDNPIEISDIVGAFIDNKNELPSCNLWVSLDYGVFINITNDNCDSFIKYLYERYPY